MSSCCIVAGMHRTFQKSAATLAIALSIGTVSSCSPAPKTAEDWQQQGIIQTQNGNLDEAIKSFDQAVLLEADSATTLVNRGLVRDELGDHEGAIADYSQAIALEPTLTAAYYNRANAYHNSGQYEKSIDSYTQAIAQEADFAYAYVNRAINHEMLGNIEPAIQDLSHALSLFEADEDTENAERITTKLDELQPR